MPRDRRHPRLPLLVRAAYAACVVLVFSFILFEVLDVDGSDFPRPTSALRANMAEPPHNLKRLIPSAPAASDVALTTAPTATATWTRARVASPVVPASTLAALWRFPSSLPRSSLDAPPAG